MEVPTREKAPKPQGQMRVNANDEGDTTMANEQSSEITMFVQELSQFRDGLTTPRQEMLDAILAAAEASDEADDTVGQGMMNPYTAHALVKTRMEDMQRSAEQERLALAASQTSDDMQAHAAVQHHFDWLVGWLANHLAHHAAAHPAQHAH